MAIKIPSTLNSSSATIRTPSEDYRVVLAARMLAVYCADTTRNNTLPLYPFTNVLRLLVRLPASNGSMDFTLYDYKAQGHPRYLVPDFYSALMRHLINCTTFQRDESVQHYFHMILYYLRYLDSSIQVALATALNKYTDIRINEYTIQ